MIVVSSSRDGVKAGSWELLVHHALQNLQYTLRTQLLSSAAVPHLRAQISDAKEKVSAMHSLPRLSGDTWLF